MVRRTDKKNISQENTSIVIISRAFAIALDTLNAKQLNFSAVGQSHGREV